MKKNIITPIYYINIIFQSIFDLIAPIAVMLLFAWLLDKYTSVGGVIYVVFILLGVFAGLYSMITFIIRASAAVEELEKQRARDADEQKQKDEKRKALKNEAKEYILEKEERQNPNDEE